MRSYFSTVLLFFCFLLFSYSELKSQQVATVSSNNEFQAYLYKELAKYKDTLLNNIRDERTIYARFQITENGAIDSVLFSDNQPIILVDALTGLLKKVSFKEFFVDTYYILPVSYNFYPEPSPGMTYIEYMMLIAEKIDIKNLDPAIKLNLNGLFEIDKSKKVGWGMKCVFLPPFKLVRGGTVH